MAANHQAGRPPLGTRCVYCGHGATYRGHGGATTCTGHNDLPALDPYYNDHPAVLAGRRPARKVPQGVSELRVDSRTTNGNAVRPRVKPASPE